MRDCPVCQAARSRPPQDNQIPTDLIARLEAATEGSRELDQLIGLAVVGFNPDMLPTQWPDIGQPPSPWLPYTTSLDAALTLVPEAMSIEFHTGPGATYSDARVMRAIKGQDEQGRRTTRYEIAGQQSAAHEGVIRQNTPALALSIAALKARATTDNHNN